MTLIAHSVCELIFAVLKPCDSRVGITYCIVLIKVCGARCGMNVSFCVFCMLCTEIQISASTRCQSVFHSLLRKLFCRALHECKAHYCHRKLSVVVLAVAEYF